MSRSDTFKEMHDEFHSQLRNKLGSMLYECTEGQRGIFNRMYESIDEIPYEKMETAFWQVENTLRKNEENGV